VNDEYVAGHLQEALAHSGETDVHVRVGDGRVLVTGTVATAARHEAVVDLLRARTDLELRDEVIVVPCDAPTEREQIT
jgi:hypothetical protein